MKVTGDFPSPIQIKQFNVEMGRQVTDQFYKDIKREINGTTVSKQNMSEIMSCNGSNQKNKIFALQERGGSNDRFQSLNHNDQRSQLHDMLIR